MYFACEAVGSGASEKCDSEMKAYESLNNVGIDTIAYVLFSMLPALNLLYLIQVGELKRHAHHVSNTMQSSLCLGDNKRDL